MTAKAWYWSGLGLLAISLISSNTGRCWMDQASALVGQVRTRAVPYVAMVEVALGRTDSGFMHMQSAAARVEAQRARMEAAQARLQAAQARLEAAAARGEFRHMAAPVDFSALSNVDFVVPKVVVRQHRIEVSGRHGRIVCPQTGADISVPEVAVPDVSVVEDPI